MQKKPSVLLITIDTLRPDHLGYSGYERNTSVHIDKIAKAGIIFDNAIAQDTWPAPSMVSISTSTYSFCHNVSYYGDSIDNSLSTLPGVLKKNGYQTCFIGPYILSQIGNFARDFDFFNVGVRKNIFFGFSRFTIIINLAVKFILYHFPLISRYCVTIYDRIIKIINNSRADIVTKKAIKWLKGNSSKPFFLWVHYFDTHAPYRPPPSCSKAFFDDGFEQKIRRSLPILWKTMFGLGGISKYITERNINDAEYYVSQYDGAIYFIDRQIGVLSSFLESLKLEKDTLIILSSDQGEYMGEHDFYFSHAGVPLEPVIKVPLIIKYSKVLPAGVSINFPVQTIDIAPTVVDILGISRPLTFQGSSLLDAMLKRKCCHAPYVFTGDKKTIAVRTDQYKLIYIDSKEIERFEKRKLLSLLHSPAYLQLKHLFGSSGFPEYLFYDLKNDPLEANNLIDTEKEKAEAFKKILFGILSQSCPKYD